MLVSPEYFFDLLNNSKEVAIKDNSLGSKILEATSKDGMKIIINNIYFHNDTSRVYLLPSNKDNSLFSITIPNEE